MRHVVFLARLGQRVKRIVDDGDAECSQVHAQLVLAPRVRLQPVQVHLAAPFDHVDDGFRVRLARLLAHEEELLALDHAAAIRERKIAAIEVRRQRLIRLAHFAALEQRLVGATAGYLARKNHHASRLAVEAVDRRQLGAVQAFLQARQQGLLHEAPGRRHGQEVRLVDHHQVFILEQDLFLKRDRRFAFQLAVVKNAHAAPVCAVGAEHGAIAIEHFAARHAVQPLRGADLRIALEQKRQHVRPLPFRQPQIAGRHAVAHGQRCGGVTLQHPSAARWRCCGTAARRPR